MATVAVSNSALAIWQPACLAQTPEQIAEGIELLPAVWLHGARLHALTEQQCIDLVIRRGEQGHGGSIFTMNVDHMRRFAKDTACALRYRRATIVTADGMPLIWASRLMGTPLPERVTGSALIWTLSAAAAQAGRSVFLVGGAPGTAEKTASVLVSRYPNLRIAGIFSEHLELQKNRRAWKRVTAALTATKPDIVFVALGSPKQEDLIDRLRQTLPRAWWLGVGIAFSFVCGEIPRAPVWMQRAGLEWIHRLAHEPRRLAKRYLVDGLPFAATLFWHAALRRWSPVRSIPEDIQPLS